MNITAEINAIKSHIQEIQSSLDNLSSSYSKETSSEEFSLLKAQFKLWLLLCLIEPSDSLYHLPFNQLIPLLLKIVHLDTRNYPKRIFTLDELRLDYNGQKGAPYYLVIDQYIVDISRSLKLYPLSTTTPISTLTLHDYLLGHSKVSFIKALTTAPILGELKV